MEYLPISLVNSLQNRCFELDFDKGRFRDNWQEIRAKQFSQGKNSIYDWLRNGSGSHWQN